MAECTCNADYFRSSDHAYNCPRSHPRPAPLIPTPPEPTFIERLAAAAGVAIKNLEASEVAPVVAVQHVIRSLKDALNG